jgi:hypothetical protein
VTWTTSAAPTRMDSNALRQVIHSNATYAARVWDSAGYAGWRTHPARATFADDMQRLVEAEPHLSALACTGLPWSR